MYKDVLMKQRFAVAAWLVIILIVVMILVVILNPFSIRLVAFLLLLVIMVAAVIYDNLIIKEITEGEEDGDTKPINKRSNKK
jgi:O-antigen ligase